MKAIRLRTEYLKEPMGIDIVEPRFYWNCEGGVRQTAYQVVAEADGEKVWDSGKVKSSAMTHIPYKGRQLKSRERVIWSVRLWNEADECGGWTSSSFEMGLLVPADWKAKWITGNYPVNKKKRYPVDCFRKRIFI